MRHTGIIHLAQGVYDIYSPIQLYPFITISGEGKIDYDFNNRIPTIVLKPDSLSASDSTKNFIFHINDTLTSQDSYFGFRSVLFKFDTSGYSKTFSKYGLAYLKNAKPINGNYRTFIYNDKVKIICDGVNNAIMYYAPGDITDSLLKHS